MSGRQSIAEPATRPLVTVVTVCLNAERHLREAIESVLSQGYPYVEYIVVDGGSTDGTLDILREYEPRFDGRMHWVSEPDEGLYDAMNKGLAMAHGELVGILNADDVYEPDAVERAVETWLAHPEAGVVYGDARNVDENGVVTLDRPAPAVVTRDVMMRGMLLCHQSMFVTRATYAAVGPYDTRYRILADYEFVMRCLREDIAFAYATANLSKFRLGGVSGAFIRRLDRELTRIRIAYGANPLSQWALYYRHAAAAFVYDRLKWSSAFRRAYDALKGRGTPRTPSQ